MRILRSYASSPVASFGTSTAGGGGGGVEGETSLGSSLRFRGGANDEGGAKLPGVELAFV